jgi:hypothetical protein
MKNHQSDAGFFAHKTIISAVRIIEFVRDKMSYIHDVSKMPAETSGVSFPHQNGKSVISMYICKQFVRYSPTMS